MWDSWGILGVSWDTERVLSMGQTRKSMQHLCNIPELGSGQLGVMWEYITPYFYFHISGSSEACRYFCSAHSQDS